MAYCYGVGSGFISKKALKERERIAERHGVTFEWTGEAACECGGQCEPFCCPRNLKWWFQWPEVGNMGDREIERAIQKDLEALEKKGAA